jgi:hypothetical protein
VRHLKTVMISFVLMLTVFAVGASGPTCAANAQGAGCSEGCKAAFGACYKSTANRAACEAQLQRCLENCLASRR